MKRQLHWLGGYLLTGHAVEEMRRRGIGRAIVKRVLQGPEQRIEIRPGRVVLQSRVRPRGSAKTYLVRVFIDVDRDPHEVVTVYKTSKVSKYWRQEP